MASAASSQQFGPSDRLFAAIGDFLADHRLSVDPANYAFAYRVISQPKGPLATIVASVTDGGVRLTSRDIEELGFHVSARGATVARDGRLAADITDGSDDDDSLHSPEAAMQVLVARTQMQVEGFADTVRAMRAETEDFGRDLQASANALRGPRGAIVVDDVARLAGSMIERVHTAENRLAAATEESEALRRELEEARHDARRDPLTGLANRRAFEDRFTEVAAAGRPICIALCDIDHFKAVNDRFGHAVGDRVLKVIAGALSSACGTHLVSRYGGEEFAVLFTDCAIDTALATLEAARTLVAAKRYRLRESDTPLGAVTFSGGVSLHCDGEPVGPVMVRADRLLYRAKDMGRNNIQAE